MLWSDDAFRERLLERTFPDYFALLCGYVRESSVQKAEAIMQEMRDKRVATSPLPYNKLIDLYFQTEEFDKINILMQEMESNGIRPCDKYTVDKIMAAFVATSNISGMQIILSQMDKNPKLVRGCETYARAANGYLKVGLTEPALAMLRKMEEIIPPGKDTAAFDSLLTLYAKTGRKDELYRVWNKYKQLVELNFQTFCHMITSLSKLEDIEGAERIFEEWESQCTNYDFRVLHRLLTAYCKKGLLEKAEAAVGKIAEQRTVYPSTWNVLARGYVEHNQMSKALKMFKRALSVSHKRWKPCPLVLNACLDYLEVQGDIEGMQELNKSLKSLEPLTRDMYLRLVRTSIATGKVDCLDLSLMNDFPADEGINKILTEAKSRAGESYQTSFLENMFEVTANH